MTAISKRTVVTAGLLMFVGTAAVIYAARGPEGEDEESQGWLRGYGSLLGMRVDSKRSDNLLGSAGEGEHPLMPAIRWAHSAIDDIEAIDDYSCTLVKRERVGGRLIGPQYLALKVRHRPFSVYLEYLAPRSLRGREVIYVAGENNNKLVAHTTGIQRRLLSRVSLRPTSRLAMTDNRYPITEVGILRLTQRLIEVGEHDMQQGNCQVAVTSIDLDKQPCTCIEVVHPDASKDFLFHKAKIYIENKRRLPVRYEAYDWPENPGEQPPLIEEYTYLNLKLNNGFTDDDFSPDNPEYGFTGSHRTVASN